MYQLEYLDLEKNDKYEETIKKVLEQCFKEEGMEKSKIYVSITLTTPEHIHEIRYEIHVIVQHDGFDRGLFRHEVVYLLTDVEDNHDSDDEQNRNEERGHELLYYVSVQFGGKHFLLN